MRRWLSITAFGLVLLTPPVWAQHRGGGGGGAHFASHGGGSVGRSSSFSSSGFHASSAIRGGSFARSSGVHLRIGNPFYHRRAFYGRRSYYPYGAYYPYAGYYGFYDPLDSATADSYAGENYSSSYGGGDSELQRDVETLNGKVDRLQGDLDTRNRPKPGPEPATALVFRDQHVEEVRNYAIAGGTLWVLDEQSAKKISLTDLDLVATDKVNNERGVDFQVPK